MAPAVSRSQQRLMGADLARARAGKPTRTGMTQKQLAEFASTPTKGLPVKVKPKKQGKSKKGRR